MTNDCKSWYLLSHRYHPTPDKAAFEEQWDSHPSEYHQIRMFGKLVNESRWSQSWGVAYRYSSTVNTERPLHENAVVMDLIGAANNLVGCVHLGAPYNGCLQNWYGPAKNANKRIFKCCTVVESPCFKFMYLSSASTS